jgi:hypothetical protein
MTIMATTRALWVDAGRCCLALLPLGHTSKNRRCVPAAAVAIHQPGRPAIGFLLSVLRLFPHMLRQYRAASGLPCPLAPCLTTLYAAGAFPS